MHQEHEVKIDEIYWTDSALYYAGSDQTPELQQFVSHRVEILETTEVENWRWVSNC
jgi:hypothetical protein